MLMVRYGPRSGEGDFLSIEHCLLWDRLDAFRKIFGYSIPSWGSLRKIKRFVGDDKVLSIMDGLGLWSALMKKVGLDVTSTDIKKTGRHYTVEQFTRTWIEIQAMDCLTAVDSFADCNVLFMSWAPLNDTAANAVRRFRGNKIIYIGEGMNGCTGNDELHQMLEAQWENVKWSYRGKCQFIDEISYIDIPNWYGIHDVIFCYTRKT